MVMTAMSCDGTVRAMDELVYELYADRKKKRRVPRKLSKAGLNGRALRYVDRYGGPSASVREVLKRRVRKVAAARPVDADEAAAWVNEIVQELIGAGVIDDQMWANERARSLFERGFGKRRIRQKLAEKRIESSLIDAAIKHVTGDLSDPDLEAAHVYAQRRGIGQYRMIDREEYAQRDLGKMARAGFSYDIARAIVFV